MTKLFAVSDLPPGMDNGPLGCIIPAYAALLSQQGYTELSAHQQLRFLNNLNQWLHQQRIQVVDLSGQTIHRYMQSRHQRFRPRRDEAAILRRLVQLLRAHCILPEEVTQPPDNPRQRIVNDYDRYLSEERGLSISTRVNYRFFHSKVFVISIWR